MQLRPLDSALGLKPGMSGEVLIEQVRLEAIMVPKEALVYRDNLPAVFKVENNQVRLLNVEIGLADPESIEIVTGVRPGDSVVVTGQEFLNDGAMVVTEDPR